VLPRPVKVTYTHRAHSYVKNIATKNLR